MSEPESAVTASGGWCAPPGVAYDASLLAPTYEGIGFPELRVTRGGVDFTDRRTEAEKAADAAQATLVARTVEQLARARAAAIDLACITALSNGWDLHVYDPPQPYDMRRATGTDLIYLRSVGIEFTPAEHAIPTIHQHVCPDWWDEDD